MNIQSLFRDYKLSEARNHGRLPVFLDFSSDCAIADSMPINFINQITSETTDTVDGIILLASNLPEIDPRNHKEVWVRIDKTLRATDSVSAINASMRAHQMFLSLTRNGVSGIVGNLNLGETASKEADSIQELAALRSLSLEVGLPLAIDVRVFSASNENSVYLETIELGLNLAVEIGCNMTIIPGENYLSLDNHITAISDLPILLQQPVRNIIKSDPQDTGISINVPTGGIILTDMDQWEPCNLNPTILRNWAKTLTTNSAERAL